MLSSPRVHARPLLFGAIALLAAITTPLSAQRTFTSFTMFGDSFSDVGNAAALIPGLPSRFSNGPIWSDVLGASIGRSSDVTPAFLPGLASGVYAIGGALTTTSAAFPIPGTDAQIARWRQPLPVIGPTRTADASGLYVLFAGGNDLRTIANLPGLTLDQRLALSGQVANNLILQGQSLTSFGVQNLLFSYLPDLGRTPDRVGGTQSALLSQLTGAFNTTLMGGIDNLGALNSGANYWDLRLDILFQNTLTAPLRYGFTNTTDSCVGNGEFPGCDGYLFSDGLHPSSAAHALIGEAAYNLVAFDQNVAAVPEPTTLALLIAGLAFTGVAVWRRRGRHGFPL